MKALEKIIYTPLSIFKHKYTLRIVIYSCLFLFLTTSLANIVYRVSPEFFKLHIGIYNFVKDSIYQVVLFSSLGYILSKYKFCYWSILSFYGIIYIKIVWFIDSYLYLLPDIGNTIDSLIVFILLIMVIYFLKNNTIN